MTLDRVAVNRLELEKDPKTAVRLKRMDEIASSSSPYEMVHEIDELIFRVEGFNERLIDKCRETAIRRIDQLIANVRESIETRKVSSDLSNTALYPLHALKKCMPDEAKIPRMHIKIRDAEDHVDEMLERITKEFPG